ncbi:hypothetical protein L0Z13_05315 [Burkholderia multivorans]|uniref:hypothetical protein n=2 Tax=Burkholderia multivorans TaxID=87883 RepID=UPI000277D0A4|nr:hypothetical protein [Burkholderia multivorans]EJO58785.1 hypothetical protein BURMUCF1_2733 [Burkholderia multivorans ATCC BAA-247]MBU9369289.1 hypothetical protein [Burkholderia multivorans]MBU9584362.1 hypothetical protein [Burkholderia multivorans]MCO1436600.1 hypothetical protein [Burkholderia multivorans]MDN7744495.1 hypothetical protein [Burkholderia multivorans]
MPMMRRAARPARAAAPLCADGRRAGPTDAAALNSRRVRAGFAFRLRTVALIAAASVALSGCGVFGCGGAATNGAAIGGCSAGMRF